MPSSHTSSTAASISASRPSSLPSAAELVPFDALTRASHKDIYRRLGKHTSTLPPPALRTACPPPALLTYAARFILRPALLPERIPDLLDILAQIEAERRAAVDDARSALETGAAMRDDDGAEPLDDDERARLTALVDAEDDVEREVHPRHVYWKIVLALIQIDIYNLYTSPDLDVIPARKLEYFGPDVSSTSQDLHSAPEALSSPRLLHHLGQTDAERAALADACTRCDAFLRDAGEWEEAEEARLRALLPPTDPALASLDLDVLATPAQIAAFRDAIGPPVSADAVGALAEWYLARAVLVPLRA